MTSSLSEVVTALGRVEGDPELQRHAGYMHDFLAEAARTSHGRLLFPPGYRNDYDTDESLLTVYSLRGLTFPDENAKGSEDLDERLSMCVLYMAAWLAQRAMYLGDVHARKGIFIDEAWALSTFTTGRRFIERAGRDSRKHNTRVLMASQNPSDLLRLDLANLVSAAFIGRLTDETAQRDALRFIPGIQPGQGYEAIFESLSRPTATGRRGPREFVFSDGAGGIERIRMDLSAHPEAARGAGHHRRPDEDPYPWCRGTLGRLPSTRAFEWRLRERAPDMRARIERSPDAPRGRGGSRRCRCGHCSDRGCGAAGWGVDRPIPSRHPGRSRLQGRAHSGASGRRVSRVPWTRSRTRRRRPVTPSPSTRPRASTSSTATPA